MNVLLMLAQAASKKKTLTPHLALNLADCCAVLTKRRWPLIGAGVPLGLFLLLVAAWGIDSLVSGDQVVRNVVVDQTDLGGLTKADVVNAGADLTARLSNQPLTVSAGDASVASDPVTLGVSVDSQRLASDALAARRGGFFLLRPIRWLGTFFSEESIQLYYLVDADKANRATAELINPELTRPVDPSLVLQGDMLTVSPGADGLLVQDGALAEALTTSVEAGAPYSVNLATVALRPDLDTTALQAVADEANNATDSSIRIQVLDSEVVVEGTEVRSWISLDTTAASPDWVIDSDQARAALLTRFPALGDDRQQARFDVIEGRPVIIPAAESVVCCDERTGDLLKAGLLAAPEHRDEPNDDNEGENSQDAEVDPSLRSIRLEPAIAEGDEGVAELESLGIVEEISSFTTLHKCCENRVTNIQLMASIVQGYIIRPGEQFDLNQVVGKRDRARGFLAAGAIANGLSADQVGGGVSQFTTTIFNASFFGGLDFDEYQSHSIYFSRYPKGREATISWPKPDFIVTNPTEYGILVWPTWTDTSITVTFYSTKNIEVFCIARDDSLVSGPDECDKTITSTSQGECTRWTTRRRRIFPDGEIKDDKVFAVYRPGFALDCNGNSTRPTTTTTTDPDAVSTTSGGEGSTSTTDDHGTTTTVATPTTTTTVATTTETTPTP